jgi:hypothetical protein
MGCLWMAACCGSGTTHKCDFTPTDKPGIDASTDGPMLCGTQVCENGQVCCYTKAPPLANCIDPINFEAQHCEKMDLPCFSPMECPLGTNCCLMFTADGNGTVTCRPQLLCPGDGVNTYIACSTEADCPINSPSCNYLTTVMDKKFNICSP